MQVLASTRYCWLDSVSMKFLHLAFLAGLTMALPALAALPLQPWLDTALPGARIRLPPAPIRNRR